MKFQQLHIKSYLHLEDIKFDFTYPTNHAKAGQPLDKICIIGQSATGKTKILEAINSIIIYLNNLEVVGNNSLFFRNQENNEGLNKAIKLIKFINFKLLFNIDKEVNFFESVIIKNGRQYQFHDSASGSVSSLISDIVKQIYITSDVLSDNNIKIFNQNPLEILDSNTVKSIFLDIETNKYSYNYKFNATSNDELWIALLYEILDYRKKFTQKMSELINKGLIADAKRLNKEFEKWAEKNKNPIEKIADFFNPVLKKLNLEVDLINTEFPIPIKSLVNDTIVPISELSTGTKGLLLNSLPLYKFNTDDAVILIDEPERSLFPDMQIDLMEYYQSLAPNAQFIVATHSPFIAASFEPEERFILYYDENGKVAVRQGESPIGDDPNDMLKNDFNINYYNKFGQEAYKRYVSLKEKMSKEKNPQKKKELLKEVSLLGDEYKF